MKAVEDSDQHFELQLQLIDVHACCTCAIITKKHVCLQLLKIMVEARKPYQHDWSRVFLSIQRDRVV